MKSKHYNTIVKDDVQDGIINFNAKESPFLLLIEQIWRERRKRIYNTYPLPNKESINDWRSWV